ncbi:MAG: thiamine pyrophosphate-dependent enzyme [Thermoanaerobaculia bacterium]|nr:thiamine pyrophosphate-dependent enzyme [Thermoanaerobaculia bacterium]
MQTLAQRRAAATLSSPTSFDLGPDPTSAVANRGESLAESPAARQLDLSDSRVVSAVAHQLARWGVEEAFGVSGGAIALLFDAIEESPINLRHFRHESGAAFAACEAYFAYRRPTVCFTTTGPGLLNALTGITAARWEGAKVVLLSGHTNSQQRGRWASQETSSYTMPQDALYARGALFDFAVRMESATELPEVLRRIGQGLQRPGGFVAHICLPMSVQSSRVDLRHLLPAPRIAAPSISETDITACARILRSEPFAIWVGFGASQAANQVIELAERSGARVFCSPRAKGIFPEDHLNYLGVSGLGGHDPVSDYMVQEKPGWTLVLGSRLGEPTSFWDRDLLPREGFLHVDIDPEVPGSSFPDFHTIGIQSEIGNFLDELLRHFPEKPKHRVLSDAAPRLLHFEGPFPRRTPDRSPVRPQAVMEMLQRHVVEETGAAVIAECGNSFAWCNHHLRFSHANRYRVSTLFGSMGHAAAGVVGRALAQRGKAVAVVGDGSMLMNSEVSTAVQYRAQAVWVVLNDSGYGMCRDGHRALGLTGENIDIPTVDFTDWARSMGADGIKVDSENMLETAFTKAMRSELPFVLDIRIDPGEASPLLKRFESLIQQGNSKNVAGWEQ